VPVTSGLGPDAACKLDHAGLLNEEKNKKKCYWVKDRQQKRPVFFPYVVNYRTFHTK
jgi:hypothetical protein